jgi:hypothetical protein
VNRVTERDDDERVSLAPLDAESALLAVKPDDKKEAPPSEDEGTSG